MEAYLAAKTRIEHLTGQLNSQTQNNQLQITIEELVENNVKLHAAVDAGHLEVERLNLNLLSELEANLVAKKQIGAITSELEFKLGRSRQLETEVAKLQSQLAGAAVSQEPSTNNAKHTPTHLKSRIKAKLAGIAGSSPFGDPIAASDESRKTASSIRRKRHSLEPR